MRSHLVAILISTLAACVNASGTGPPPDLSTSAEDLAGPSGVAVTSTLANELDVSWTADPNASSYYVYKGPSGTEPAYWQSIVGPNTATVAGSLIAGGTYCFAVRSVIGGAASAPSDVVCGTAAGGGSGATSGTLTRVISPNPTGVPAYATIDVVNLGIGNHTANIDQYFTVGDHLHAIRLYVQDNTACGTAVGCPGAGPTELISRLKTYTTSGAVPTTVATSNASDGSGTVQVLSMTGLDIAIVTGGATHSLQTIDNQGVAPSIVWSIEVDYAAAL